MNDLSKFIRYSLTKEDVDNIRKGLPKNVTVCYMNGVNYEMDYGIISNLKSLFAIDVIINTNFEETNFADWLKNREIPYYKIYAYVSGGVKDNADIYRLPSDIDFKSDLYLTLEKKILPKIKGVPTSVEYYEKKEVFLVNGRPSTEYSDIICRVDFSLYYDLNGFIFKKDAILKWYLSDDTLCNINCDKYVVGSTCTLCSKNIGDTFDPILDSAKIIEEGVNRRRTIYNELQIPALAFLQAIFPTYNQLELIGLGRDFMSFYKADFDSFIYESLTVLDPADPFFGKKVIVKKMALDTTHAWLDSVANLGFGDISPRQFLMGSLDL